VLELNHNFDVVKKLKLVGEPFKIYKNSAFIKGMFNSMVTIHFSDKSKRVIKIKFDFDNFSVGSIEI